MLTIAFAILAVLVIERGLHQNLLPVRVVVNLVLEVPFVFVVQHFYFVLFFIVGGFVSQPQSWLDNLGVGSSKFVFLVRVVKRVLVIKDCLRSQQLLAGWAIRAIN